MTSRRPTSLSPCTLRPTYQLQISEEAQHLCCLQQMGIAEEICEAMRPTLPMLYGSQPPSMVSSNLPVTPVHAPVPCKSLAPPSVCTPLAFFWVLFVQGLSTGHIGCVHKTLISMEVPGMFEIYVECACMHVFEDPMLEVADPCSN